MAETVPAWRSKGWVEVSLPEDPVIVPDVRTTRSTVSSKVVTLNVPPLTVRREVSLRTPLAPSDKVPAVTVVPLS